MFKFTWWATNRNFKIQCWFGICYMQQPQISCFDGFLWKVNVYSIDVTSCLFSIRVYYYIGFILDRLFTYIRFSKLLTSQTIVTLLISTWSFFIFHINWTELKDFTSCFDDLLTSVLIHDNPKHLPHLYVMNFMITISVIKMNFYWCWIKAIFTW